MLPRGEGLFYSRICNKALFLAAFSLPLAALGEVPPEKTSPCYSGAYYRKAVSSNDIWTGMEGVVKLPTPVYDSSRMGTNGRFQDNASVYMGGRVGDNEIDAGLSWEVIREPNGSISKNAKAFRPFWRNDKWNSAPAKPDFYYYPGDVVRMKVVTLEDDKLQLSIELLSRADSSTTDGQLVAKPSTTNSKDGGSTFSIELKTTETKLTKRQNALTMVPADAMTSFSVSFAAQGFGPDNIQQFKRVNAIDLLDKNDNQLKPTKTKILGAEWRDVKLLRGTEQLPMTPSRYTDMRCPDTKQVKVTPIGETGEKIDIFGRD